MSDRNFSGFVHDLRGEIQVAMGATELALSKCDQDAVSRHLETTMASLQRAAELLADPLPIEADAD